MEPDANNTKPAASRVTTGQMELLQAASAELVARANEGASCSGTKGGGEGNEDARSMGLRRSAPGCCMIGGRGSEEEARGEHNNVGISIEGMGRPPVLAESCEDKTSPREYAARQKANAAHSLYQRRRRQKINQSLEALRRIVPNAHEADDHNSILDKTIEHIKHLRAHDHMVDAINQNQLMGMRNLERSNHNMGAPNTVFMMPCVGTMGIEPSIVPMQTFLPPVLFPALLPYASNAYAQDVPNPMQQMQPEMEEISLASNSEPPSSSEN